MKVVLFELKNKVNTMYKKKEIKVVQYTVVTAFLFLRFFGPTIISPKLFGFVSKYPISRK